MTHRRSLLLALLVLVPSCSKSSGDTTIINQDIVPADPVAKEWRIPEMLGPDNEGGASLGDVRFDAAGNAVAVFEQAGIWARLWTPGEGWGTLERVSDSSSSGTGAKLAVDAAGNALVVYSQRDDLGGGPETSIWWNRYTAGTGWGAPDLLETDNVIDLDVQIAGDATGNAIAVWNSYDGISSSDIRFNRYVAGTGWIGAAPLESGPEGAFSARIGMDSSGNAIAVWSQDGGGFINDVMSSRYVAGAGWTAAAPLESSGLATFDPEIDVNAAGDAIAVWTQFDLVSLNLWSASYRPASGWGAPTLVETDDTSIMTISQVVIDTGGGGTAVWTTDEGDLWSARYSPGSGWTMVERVTPLMNGVSPRLAISASGATGVVWIHNDGNRTNILFSTHTGGPWTPAVFVEFDEPNADHPALAMDANGNALALWTYYDDLVGFRTCANWYD